MAVEKVLRVGLTDIKRVVFECACGALSAPSAMRLSDQDSCPACRVSWTRGLEGDTVQATNSLLRGIEYLTARERGAAAAPFVLRFELVLEP